VDPGRCYNGIPPNTFTSLYKTFLKGGHHFYDQSTSILVFLRSRVAQLYCWVDIRTMAIN